MPIQPSNEYQNIIAVSNRHLCSRPLPEQIRRICELVPKAMILREKDMTQQEYFLLAKEILPICQEYHIPCILHTFLETAKELNHSAIHLPLPLLRKYQGELSSFSVVGTSVHSVDEAIEAQHIGASYLIAGHIYATDCKRGLSPRGTEFLRKITECAEIPVYAIGGIHMNTGQLEEVMKCGAKGGCIMSGMMEI